MRILFVNQYFPPDATNSAHLLGDLTEDLALHHEIWVVAGRPSYNPEAGSSPPHSVRVLHSFSTSFDRARMIGRLVNYVSFVFSALGRSLFAPKADLVVTMTDPPIVGLVGYLASLRHRCPLAIICQDVYPDIAVAMGKLRNPYAIALWTWVNKWLRRRAARLVVVGRDMEQKLQSQGTPPERILYIPNWASAPSARTEVSQLRERMGWTHRFVVMHAGNVGIPQNLPVLIDAAAHLEDLPEVLVVILGDGAMKPELESKATKMGLSNVAFLPHCSKDEAQALMAAADVHLVSLAPGLWGCAAPSKMYGIMAAGRPIIAAVEEGSEPDLLIAESGCGIRVEPSDANDLAGAVVRMRGASTDEIGQRGFELLNRRLSRETITTAYRKVFEELVEGA